MASIAGLLALNPIVRTTTLLLGCNPDCDSLGSLLLELLVVLNVGVESELRLLPRSTMVPAAEEALVGKSSMEFLNRKFVLPLPLYIFAPAIDPTEPFLPA